MALYTEGMFVNLYFSSFLMLLSHGTPNSVEASSSVVDDIMSNTGATTASQGYLGHDTGR